MKRKILSFVLVAAMLVSMVVFAPSAGATESLATLELGDAYAIPGGTVNVDLTITTEAMTGLQFMFEYDASKLTYEGISWTEAWAGFPADLTGNELFGKYTQNGPYRVESWATGIGVGAVDLSEGVVMATLTFTVKEDAALGDTSVSFTILNEGNNQPNKIETGSASLLPDEITFVDSTVTIFAPDQFPVGATTPEEMFEFDAEWGDILGFSEDVIVPPSVLVIPSQIGGVDVYGVSGFSGYTFDAVVVPENVCIYSAAFLNSAVTSVFFAGDATLEQYAIGWNGRIQGTSIKNAKPYADTTIYGASGSAAETYAGTSLKFVDTSAYYTMTLDGVAFQVPATTTLPDVMAVAGGTAIAWTDGTNTYAAGSAITLTGDVALTPVTINAPATAATVDFKLTAEEADLAMRFTASLSLEDYAKLADLGSVKLGMLITPAKYVSKAGSFTKEALDDIDAKNGAYVDIAIDGYYEVTATDYIFAGSLKGFSAATLAKNPDFAAVLYATVTTEGGDVFTVYGDYDFGTIQNVKGVAESLTTSSDLTDTQKGWLTTLVGKFTA